MSGNALALGVMDPGVYFGPLDAERYHRDPSLGSGDLRRLLQSAPDYWWNSAHNPLNRGRPVAADAGEEPGDVVPDSAAPENMTSALIFGRAIHTCVLEGEALFRTQYAPTDSPGNIKAGKEERREIIAEAKVPLKRDDWNRILLAAAMIRNNTEIAPAFDGGMREVSVFWRTPDGVPLKARFDNLKRKLVVDLKSIRNVFERDFYQACRLRLKQHKLHIQAGSYLDGRGQLARFVREGRVFGEVDPEWLDEVAAEEDYRFLFVFYQAAGAPISWGFYLSPANEIVAHNAARAIDQALNRYRDFSARYSRGEPWLLSEPVQELDISELPFFD